MSTTNYIIQPGGQLSGVCYIPGDKSISHRSIILGAIAQGVSQIDGFLDGLDCLATLAAIKQLGVQVEGPINHRVIIHGVGRLGLKEPKEPLDLGNSGTSMRLLAGLLAGQPFDSTLVGDSSLMKRPMGRIIKPLNQMGAKIDGTESEYAPLHIKGNQQLLGIDYVLPMASAQVKSCILLAGLYANGETSVTEPSITRDHTERMLTGFGYTIQKADHRISIHGGGELNAVDMTVPADISSAAFFLVAATICPGSNLLLKNIGINPTRTGVISILQLMGANIKLVNKRLCGDEPVADIAVKHAPLEGIEIPAELVSLAIDEFPSIFIAAAAASGATVLKGAKELRVKESDRIASMIDGLLGLGIDAESLEDGAIIHGGQIQGGVVDSFGDHRVAMAFTMAGLVAQKMITITGCNNVKTSFPNFVTLCEELGIKIVEK